MSETELIQTATDALRRTLSAGSVTIEIAPVLRHADPGYDAVMEVIVGGESHAFDVEVKRRLSAAVAVRLAERARPSGRRLVVISDRVSTSAGEVLRERGVGYVDAAGNAHIEAPPLFIHVEGRTGRPHEAPVRAFAGEGLRVVFLLLLAPELASEPYRRLAELSGASHGVVQYTMGDLERMGHLVRMGRTERRLRDVGGLLDRWAAGYIEVLRPKISMGTFRFTGADAYRELGSSVSLTTRDYWGGEPAAARMTGYLKPARLTVYTHDERLGIMKRLRVLPDEDGPLTIVRAFWTAEAEGEPRLDARFLGDTVPAVVAYADLLASNDPRNAEVAALLRDRVLAEGDDG